MFVDSHLFLYNKIHNMHVITLVLWRHWKAYIFTFLHRAFCVSKLKAPKCFTTKIPCFYIVAVHTSDAFTSTSEAQKGTLATFEAEWGIFGPTDFNGSEHKNCSFGVFQTFHKKVGGTKNTQYCPKEAPFWYFMSKIMHKKDSKSLYTTLKFEWGLKMG